MIEGGDVRDSSSTPSTVLLDESFCSVCSSSAGVRLWEEENAGADAGVEAV
jgi:hypothetical protein